MSASAAGMKPRRYVLFDWDGTLIRSHEVKMHNAGIVFQAAFAVDAVRVEAAFHRWSGIPRRELFDAIAGQLGLPPIPDDLYADLSRRFSELNLSQLCDPAAPGLLPEDTPRALAGLAAAGCCLYVSSSADQDEIRRIAASLGLADYFSRSGGEILGSRPGFQKGGQHVAYVLERHHASRSELVFVGDEPADIRLGRDARVFVVARMGTHERAALEACQPDMLIGSLDELVELLAQPAPGGVLQHG